MPALTRLVRRPLARATPPDYPTARTRDASMHARRGERDDDQDDQCVCACVCSCVLLSFLPPPSLPPSPIEQTPPPPPDIPPKHTLCPPPSFPHPLRALSIRKACFETMPALSAALNAPPSLAPSPSSFYLSHLRHVRQAGAGCLGIGAYHIRPGIRSLFLVLIAYPLEASNLSLGCRF